MPNPRSTAPNPYVPDYFPGYGVSSCYIAREPPGKRIAKLSDGPHCDARAGMPPLEGQAPLTPVSSASAASSRSISRRPAKRGRSKRKRDELETVGPVDPAGVDDGAAGFSEGVGWANLGDQETKDGDGGREDRHDDDELESVSSTHEASLSASRSSRAGRAGHTETTPTIEPRMSMPASLGTARDAVVSEGTGRAQAESSNAVSSQTQSDRPRRQAQRSMSTQSLPASTAPRSTDPPQAKPKTTTERKRPEHQHQHQQLRVHLLRTPSCPRPEEVTLIPHGLPPIHTTADPHWLYLFFRFCSERHTMQDKRDAGVPRDKLSEDETMRKSFVGNVYRELDRGSVRVTQEVIGVGDQSAEEVCFRLFLYCGFHEHSTWTTLVAALGYVPRWSTFVADLPIYERALHTRSFIHRKTLYTSGFQLVPPTRYYGLNLPHYAATLRFVKSLMDSGLPHRLMATCFAVDASHLLQSFPTLGPFLSLAILCYLNDSAGFKWFWRDFASCGPGARGYMQKIFGKAAINSVAAEEAGLRWLRENQWVIWKRLGKDPPYAKTIKGIRPGMRCLDIENALCWCHRYVVDYTKNGWKSLADVPLPARTAVGRPRVKREDGYGADAGEGDDDDDHETEFEADEPAWCEREEDVGGSSKAVQKGDYDEIKERLPPTDEGEEVYEVEKIVCRKGQRGGKDGLFRVRWKGWAPEDDTWERASSLKDGAGEALQEWVDWEEAVWASIERVKNELPWTRPEILGGEVKEEYVDREEEEPDPESERRRSRPRKAPNARRAPIPDPAGQEELAPRDSEPPATRTSRASTSSRTSRASRKGDGGLMPAGTTASKTTLASVTVTTPEACEASRMEEDADAVVKEEPR